MDAFTRTLGTSQGRLVRASGEALFVLGELEPGRLSDLRPGDCVEVAQRVDLTGVALVRVRGEIRLPKGSGAWRVALRIDGTDVAGVTCAPGRARKITDLAANVSKRSGVAELAVRLTLLASP